MSRVLQEKQHPGEFIVSLANHTRSKEEGTLAPGQEIADGTPVVKDGNGDLVKATSTVDGILIGTYTLSTDDEPVRVAYVARDAEVKEALVQFDSGTKATVKAALEAKGIIFR